MVEIKGTELVAEFTKSFQEFINNLKGQKFKLEDNDNISTIEEVEIHYRGTTNVDVTEIKVLANDNKHLLDDIIILIPEE